LEQITTAEVYFVLLNQQCQSMEENSEALQTSGENHSLYFSLSYASQ